MNEAENREAEQEKTDPSVELARSDRLLLRLVSQTDAADIAKACADPEIARFIRLMPPPYTVEDAREYIATAISSWERGDQAVLVTADATSGELLGMVSVPLVDGGGVGYWIKRSARGRGAMSEALQLALGWLERERGVAHTVLRTHPANVASQRVAERAGYERVGLVNHERPYRDGERKAVKFERTGPHRRPKTS
jgi:RimJ/RimL family protein N-acetyltransferase